MTTSWPVLSLAVAVLLLGSSLVIAAEANWGDDLSAEERATLKSLTSEWKEEVESDTSQRRVVEIFFSKDLNKQSLDWLGRLHTLRILDLQLTSLDDADLKQLAGLTQLESVKFGTRVSGSGLPHLAKAANLQTLLLGGKQVTNDALPHLELFPKLKKLGLVATSITDAGMPQIVKLKELQLLSLYSTPITDAAVEQMAALPQLKMLYLGHTKITDASIPHFQKCRQLGLVAAGSSRITPAGFTRLKAALPDAVIVD